MSDLAPLSAALKLGFLVVFYLFLMWVARSALRDLRSGRATRTLAGEATGLHATPSLGGAGATRRAPRLVVERATGHQAGMIYDLDGTLVLGRGDQAEIRLEDPFASSRHARLYEQGDTVVIEDLGSTNGTYLNEELLETPRPLHPRDRLRIGESEFTFEVG